MELAAIYGTGISIIHLYVKKKKKSLFVPVHSIFILSLIRYRSGRQNGWRYLHVLVLYCCCWSLLYSAILRSQSDPLHSRVILHQWLVSYSAFLNIHRSGVLWCCLIVKWLVPRETAAFLACSLCTIQPCAVSTLLHAKPHTKGACVSGCNLPPALLAEWPGSFTCCSGYTGGLKGYWNESQDRRLTLEKKILPPLLPCTFLRGATLQGLTLRKFVFDVCVGMFCFMFAQGLVLWSDMRKGKLFMRRVSKYSTFAYDESLIYRRWPCAVIGMFKSNY